MSQSEFDRLPPPVNDFLPTTFAERGIAIPFTTPMLAGTRARPGDRVPMELIIPNPSGGRGVYILPWQDISALCRPTVHDARLTATIATVQGVTPMTIRRAAREAASLGFAGRGAAAAARAAETAERNSGMIVNFEMLLAVVRSVEEPGENDVPPERERPAELERRAKRAIARIAPGLGRTPDSIANALEQIATLYCGIGIGATGHGCRIPQLLGRMLHMRGEFDTYMSKNSGEAMQDAELVAGALDLTVTGTKVVVTDCAAMAADIKALLRKFIIEPESLAQLLAKPEWLLDGWDRIVGLWETAEAHLGQEATLAEMVNLVPSVPRELSSWVSHQLNIDTDLQRHRRKVILMEDWRTGRNVTDLVGRNEALLEHAA